MLSLDLSKGAIFMSEEKTKLTDALVEMLSTQLDGDHLVIVREAMTKVLADYNVTEQCTKLVVHDDRNERLLKRYVACMSIDGRSEKTINLYYRTLKRFMEFLGLPLDKVGTYDIRFFLASMKETGISDRTLENYRSYLSAFYQWMCREDIIMKNPCDKIKPIKYKEEVRLPFSDTEIDSLRSACKNERQRAILELLLSSGVRVEELVMLNVNDLDLKNRSVHVKEGKGKKERITYMSEICAYHIGGYLESRKHNTVELFVNNKTHNRTLPGGIRSILKDLGKRAGVDNVHPHRFRRTFATNLSKRGMDVQTVSKLMGHSSIDTTMIYVYEDKSRIAQEYNKYTA